MKTNKDITYLKKCKICGNKNLKKVLFINEQYISATFVKTNKNNKLTKIKTPLTLVLCEKSKKKEMDVVYYNFMKLRNLICCIGNIFTGQQLMILCEKILRM